MTDEFDLLRDVDEPRPLPVGLRRRLEWTLTGEDPAVIALADADRPRAVPPDLADRVAAAVATDTGVAMPAPVRRRIERSLIGRPAWSRAVAVAAALLFVVASAVVIGGGRERESDNLATGRRRLEAPATPATSTAPDLLSPEAAPPARAATPPAPTKRARGTTPTTGTFAAGASGDAAEAPAAAPAGRAAPTVTVTPSTARRGEEVTARATGFSSTMVSYTLRAPSGRVVLQSDGSWEFRFMVPVTAEPGRHTLVVVGSADTTERAEAYLDVVVA